MNMAKCPQGHYYDKDKFLSCPHCDHIPVVALSTEDQTAIATAVPSGNAVKQISHALQKTVGWLVCTSGNMLGESFPLREGANHIGRSTAMDVSLLYENSVSRENHAVITYDPHDYTFTLTANATVKIKEQECHAPTLLKDRDTLTLGSCMLTFAAFCNASFHWDQTN